VTNETKTIDLYDALVAAGVPVDHHESDLYFRATPEAWAIYNTVRAAMNYIGCAATTFFSQVDGKLWVDVPFAYSPWWRRRTGGV